MATVGLLPEIEALKHTAPLLPLSVEALPKLRNLISVQQPALSDAVERTDYTVDEANGVFVRVHRPVGSTLESEGLACVYSIHGGGYVLGSCDMDNLKLERWCARFQIVAVSVEYRLAPETPYPGALEDCYAGLKWTYDNAVELGIDPNKIGITGVSAGGGLCAALALLARDRGEVSVQFQLLDSPMLDDRQITPSSQLDDLLIWPKTSNTFGWKCYLGDLYGTDNIAGTAAVARAEDLSGLPEAYVCVGGADGFRDEATEYAMRLYGAGVPTELHVYSGVPHGMNLFSHLDAAKRYNADQKDWLRRQFERLGATLLS